ncbi:MAG: exodeoxyribonuclease VII large subunit [Eubacteriales bacterium]|nr:exodeoxyribonuclease VII large subunit [Eubacteriales bacterium]
MTYSDLCGFSSYVAVDLETTGLYPQRGDTIIEIAALKYVNNVIVDELVTFVNPHRAIPPFITELTGITDAMVSGSPSIEDVIPQFIEFLGELPIVAHNADFEMSFIQPAVINYRGFLLDNPPIDTLLLTRELLPQLHNHKLGTVQKYLGIHADTLHRAKADAYVCGEILKKVIEHFTKKLIHDRKEAEEKKAREKETPTSTDSNIITITQLNKYIKGIIERDNMLFDVTVKGEISNFKRQQSGHCYMSLKDEGGAIRAIMFKGDAIKLRFDPENGMKVIATGRVSVYERDGQYQLYLNSMQPDGIGDLFVAFEQLKEKLKLEGLFDESRKKPIPKFPERVGVITSPTGAAVRDIITVMTRRYPLAEIVLYPAQVQGEGCSKQVRAGIEYFNQQKNVDVIIAGRGGGSIEELWVFNEEETARAIADSQIPIISAVGHETDFTIADFVADLRAATPSAAAELAVPSFGELNQRIDGAVKRMKLVITADVENKKNLLKRFAVKSPVDYIRQCQQRSDNTYKALCDSVQNLLLARRNSFSLNAGRLDAMSPLQVISRGYSVMQNADGNIVRMTKDVKVGDKVITRLKDGRCISIVDQLEYEDGRE